MTTRHGIALTLLTLGAVVSLLNWTTLFATWRTGRFVSSVPLIGGVCLGVGAVLIPALRPFAWAAILVDYGTLSLAPALPSIARESWQTCRFNLLEEYLGSRGRTTVRLRLFRRNIFTLQWDIRRRTGEFGLVSMGRIGTWEREGHRLVLRIVDDRAVLEPLRAGGTPHWRCLAGFGFCDQDPDITLGGMELGSRR